MRLLTCLLAAALGAALSLLLLVLPVLVLFGPHGYTLDARVHGGLLLLALMLSVATGAWAAYSSWHWQARRRARHTPRNHNAVH